MVWLIQQRLPAYLLALLVYLIIASVLFVRDSQSLPAIVASLVVATIISLIISFEKHFRFYREFGFWPDPEQGNRFTRREHIKDLNSVLDEHFKKYEKTLQELNAKLRMARSGSDSYFPVHVVHANKDALVLSRDIRRMENRMQKSRKLAELFGYRLPQSQLESKTA